MNKTQGITLFVSVVGLLGAASAATPKVRPGFSSGGTLGLHEILVPSRGGREPINAANRPAKLHPELRGAVMRFGEMPDSGETSRDIFTSNWWPMKDNGIADRWRATRTVNYEDFESNPDDLSPAEKYDLVFYPGQTKTIPQTVVYTSEEMRKPPEVRGPGRVRRALDVAGPTTAWEIQNHGNYQDTIPESWWGHCNGWASYVTAERDGAPLRDVRVRRGESGRVVECNSRDPECVLFRMADIEALFAEVYYHDASTMAGVRCNTEESKIERDSWGRPREGECRDLNPGTFHVALTGLLGKGAHALNDMDGPVERLPLLIDYSYADEVWSFPVVKYQIRESEEVDETKASQLVCNGTSRASGCRSYVWNENATRFARIRMSAWTVGYETSGANLLNPPLSRERVDSETVYHYVLELDSRGTILGGEWIDSPRGNGNNSKELHPDFVYLSVYPDASDENDDDRGGNKDNPYVSYNAVKEILRLARTTGRR